LGFKSSSVHSISVLLQFAAWCVVAFFALVRPSRKSRRNSSVSSVIDTPVIRFVNEDSL
jgi:preprotein translocase subunit YajC